VSTATGPVPPSSATIMAFKAPAEATTGGTPAAGISKGTGVVSVSG
jgi:hypothetical protein